MDKTIEQIFRTFNHIARELQIYVISGFLVLLNIYVIDFFYYNQSIYKHIGRKEFILPGLFVAYVIGHISMALFYVILEWRKYDKKLNKILQIDYEENTSVLPSIYKKNQEAYNHFIERYDLLIMMRWAWSAAFFINFVVNIVYIIFHKYYWQVCLLTAISFVVSIILYMLAAKTEKDYSDRIKSMNDVD